MYMYVFTKGEISTGEYKDIGRVTEFRFGMRVCYIYKILIYVPVYAAGIVIL